MGITLLAHFKLCIAVCFPISKAQWLSSTPVQLTPGRLASVVPVGTNYDQRLKDHDDKQVARRL